MLVAALLIFGGATAGFIFTTYSYCTSAREKAITSLQKICSDIKNDHAEILLQIPIGVDLGDAQVKSELQDLLNHMQYINETLKYEKILYRSIDPQLTRCFHRIFNDKQKIATALHIKENQLHFLDDFHKHMETYLF